MTGGYERNAPCPCGSGKKYKKCCGAPAENSLPRDVSLHRLIAYKGQVGQQRELFCREYTTLKRIVTKNVEQGLVRDAAKAGQSISCRKGCAECCQSYYIAASLQECEAIVYWLYQHENILRHFLKAMTTWQAKVSNATDCFETISCLYGKNILSQTTDEEKQAFRAAMVDYENRHITCPCLIDGACAIYEVRPYACASVVSISPAEWCCFTHPDHQHMSYLKTELPINHDLPYFVQPKSNLLLASMPQLVHDILNQGYAALSAIPGLEALQQAALSDPEVIEALGQNCA